MATLLDGTGWGTTSSTDGWAMAPIYCLTAGRAREPFDGEDSDHSTLICGINSGRFSHRFASSSSNRTAPPFKGLLVLSNDTSSNSQVSFDISFKQGYHQDSLPIAYHPTDRRLFWQTFVRRLAPDIIHRRHCWDQPANHNTSLLQRGTLR